MPGYVQKRKTFGTIQVYPVSSIKERKVNNFHIKVMFSITCKSKILSSLNCTLYIFVIVMMDWWDML